VPHSVLSGVTELPDRHHPVPNLTGPPRSSWWLGLLPFPIDSLKDEGLELLFAGAFGQLLPLLIQDAP
jgi:hypothetical protein